MILRSLLYNIVGNEPFLLTYYAGIKKLSVVFRLNKRDLLDPNLDGKKIPLIEIVTGDKVEIELDSLVTIKTMEGEIDLTSLRDILKK